MIYLPVCSNTYLCNVCVQAVLKHNAATSQLRLPLPGKARPLAGHLVLVPLRANSATHTG